LTSTILLNNLKPVLYRITRQKVDFYGLKGFAGGIKPPANLEIQNALLKPIDNIVFLTIKTILKYKRNFKKQEKSI
jgi:hypothetical protein